MVMLAAICVYRSYHRRTTGGEHVTDATYAEKHNATSSTGAGACGDIDIIAACRSDAPVLFTGAADTAESIARDIHEASGWRYGPFVVIDCSKREREVDALLRWVSSQDADADVSREPAARRSEEGAVFFREIGKLSPCAQATLDEWLERPRPCGKRGPRRRVMASNATPLCPQSRGGTFDDRLYYRLNVIHIQLEAPSQGK